MTPVGVIVTPGHHRQGQIERLPSGSFRVHVYAGIDPVSGKPRRLKRTGPDEAATATALGQLLSHAYGDRFPNREATFGQVLDKYLGFALAASGDAGRWLDWRGEITGLVCG